MIDDLETIVFEIDELTKEIFRIKAKINMLIKRLESESK